MSNIVIGDLTTANITGGGVFDVLMRAVKAHLDEEFKQARLRGPEYATVYLGALDQTMQTALAFLLQNQKASKELLLLDKQIEAATVEVEKAQAELELLNLNKDKIPAEIGQIQAQTQLVGQQKTNLVAEKLGIDARTALTGQQTLNAVKENLVLVAQECKLKAEFDMIQATTLKTQEELNLLAQKTATERAQTTAMGVDVDSIIGRQKALYAAQTSGFARDAEQKAAKLLADTWSVRRTTDEGTVADSTNKLNDATIGRAIDKLLAGVGA